MNSDQIMRDYFGSNYDKAMKTASKTKAAAREKFLKKHPYADMSKFRISVSLKKSGAVDSTDIDYVIDDDTSVDVETDTFRNNALWTSALTWPSPWGVGGTVQDFSPNTDVGGPPNDIKVFVADDLFFPVELEAFDIVGSDSNDYKDNSYLTSLYAAYVATYLCGISTEHFKYRPSVPNITTSIARYHLYYHMMRFLKDPTKMSRYVSGDVKKIVTDHRPTKTIWESKFHQGQENVGTWLSEQPRGTIRYAKQVFSQNGGQVGIRYEKAVGKTIVGPEDYKVFVATESDGLTKTGELLFQQSIESYVYCVLGSQAKTRWPIVRSGARSLQTQEVFRKLVGDTVLQDDHTVTLSNMRGAIKSTNVVLNTAVSPGIILIPSDMIILNKMISGYNNVLTIAKSGMKFGHNGDVNYFTHETVQPVRPPPVAKPSTAGTAGTAGTADVKAPAPVPGIRRGVQRIPVDRTNLYVFLASGVVGSAVAWLI